MLVSGVALSMVIFAALPETADAQQAYGDSTQVDQNTTKGNVDAAAERLVVVEPGDSLWSITQKRLGWGASPEQILNEVGRTLELNRDLLGDDPDLVLPGQELSLPPVTGLSATMPEAAPELTPEVTPAMSEPAAKPTPEPSPTSAAPTTATPEEEPVASESSVTKTPEEQPAEEEPAAEQEGIEQPDAPSLLPEASPAVSRRQLGLGILVLTFLIAILMASTLPMRRNVGSPKVGSPKVGSPKARRIHSGQANDHVSYFDVREGTQRAATFGRPDSDQPLHGSRVEALAKHNDIDLSGIGVAVSAKRKKVLRMRTPGRKKILRKRHSANAHDPQIRSCLRSAPGERSGNSGAELRLIDALRAHGR